MIAATEKLPNLEEIPAVLGDISKASPDAILVWGKPGDEKYEALVRQLIREYAGSSEETLMDPFLGEVGSALYPHQR